MVIHMTRTLILIAVAALLTSCSAERRLQRLLARHPQLNDTTVITVVDTVVVPGETIFKPVVLRTTDTVTVESERQSVRIVRIPTGSPCDTATIRADILARVMPDTMVVTRSVEVARVVPCPPGEKVASWWRTAAIILALLILAYLAGLSI